MLLPFAASNSRVRTQRDEHLVRMFGETLYRWVPTVEGNEKVREYTVWPVLYCTVMYSTAQ